MSSLYNHAGVGYTYYNSLKTYDSIDPPLMPYPLRAAQGHEITLTPACILEAGDKSRAAHAEDDTMV